MFKPFTSNQVDKVYKAWYAPSGTLANVKSMWDITRLMSRNVTSNLDPGVRRPQRLPIIFCWISRISLCLCHRLFCLTQLNLLLGESISRKKILNLFTTSKEFELRDFEGDFWLVIWLCKNWTYFQEEEKSLRTLAAKISLPMWSTQSDCGGDQHERISLKYFFKCLRWDQMK